MDTEKCAALLCVLETGSLSAAAERLGYTPSGLSRMMAALEAEAGFPLLLRSRKGVEHTGECETLLPLVREMARLGRLYAEQAAALRGAETGDVYVGSAYGIYYDWLARTVARFGAAYPGIEVHVLQGNSSELAAALEAHEADFCILSRREGSFDFTPLRRDPLLAWLPEGHPRAGDAAYPLRAFERDAYIEPYPGQETDNALAFRQHGIRPNVRYSALDVEAVRALVAAGLGVSLVNAALSGVRAFPGVATLPTEPPYAVEIGVGVPRKAALSPAAKRFIACAGDVSQIWETRPAAANTFG